MLAAMFSAPVTSSVFLVVREAAALGQPTINNLTAKAQKEAPKTDQRTMVDQ